MERCSQIYWQWQSFSWWASVKHLRILSPQHCFSKTFAKPKIASNSYHGTKKFISKIYGPKNLSRNMHSFLSKKGRMLLADGSQAASRDMSSTKMCSIDYMLNVPLLQGNSQPHWCAPLLLTNGLKLQDGICLSGEPSDVNVCFVVTTASSSRRALSPLSLPAPALQNSE